MTREEAVHVYKELPGKTTWELNGFRDGWDAGYAERGKDAKVLSEALDRANSQFAAQADENDRTVSGLLKKLATAELLLKETQEM